MKSLFLLTTLTLVALTSACSSTVDQTRANASVAPGPQMVHRVSNTIPEPNQTLLLVSLEDGSVIMQTINSNADICFKQNADSATTCLSKAEPILDPVTQAIIGFETTEARIELVARSSY